MILWTDFDVETSLAASLAMFVSGLLLKLTPNTQVTRITVDAESVERRNVGASFDPGFGQRQNVFRLRSIEPASLAMRYWSFFGLVMIDFRLAGQDKTFTLSVPSREKGERVYRTIRQRLAAIHGTAAGHTPR